MVAPVPNGRLVGYARVSTDDQDLTLQIDSLTGLGINPRRHLHREDLGSENGSPRVECVPCQVATRRHACGLAARSTRSLDAPLGRAH